MIKLFRYNSNAYFKDATFSGDVSFMDANFSSNADFKDATFSGKTYFENATFKGNAYFNGVTFSDEAGFFRTTFGGEVNFNQARFQKSVRFFGKEENKIFNSNYFTKFTLSNFESPENAEFVDVNLSKALFRHCKNLDRVGRFEKVKWSSKSFDIFGFKLFGRNAVGDEIKMDEANEEDKPYEYIAEIYRKLRLNYERNLRFAEAGDFYIGEMEMRRKGNVKIFNLIARNFSLTTVYKYFSYYGESYLLPLVWIFFAIVFFSFLLSTDFLTSTQIFLQFPPADLNEKIKDFSISINFRINSGWFVLFERIFGILFIALFVLALRRKFKKVPE